MEIRLCKTGQRILLKFERMRATCQRCRNDLNGPVSVLYLFMVKLQALHSMYKCKTPSVSVSRVIWTKLQVV